MAGACGLAGMTLFVDEVLVSRFTGWWLGAGQGLVEGWVGGVAAGWVAID